jgi:Fe-S-cluster containining protein
MKMKEIFENYDSLLSSVDRWFARCISGFPGRVKCAQGCSECCRGLFDITLLDAWFLKSGFDRLDESVKKPVWSIAQKRLKSLQKMWPDLDAPYILNIKPEDDWEVLMPDDDETPCLLLSENGECLVYDFRPMTCRLHGIPLVDISGEVFHDEWCTMNFAGESPLEERELYWEFSACFQTEIALFQQFTHKLFNQCVNELDTFIPLSLLMDYSGHDWERWWKGNSDKIRQAGFPGN